MIISDDVCILSISGILILSIIWCIRRIEINDDDDDNSISELLV
jgi:hypothetical protein